MPVISGIKRPIHKQKGTRSAKSKHHWSWYKTCEIRFFAKFILAVAPELQAVEMRHKKLNDGRVKMSAGFFQDQPACLLTR